MSNKDKKISKITQENINELYERIRTIYLSDEIPWVIGFSGGKDSSASLQLVWYAIKDLSTEQRKHKLIHVISTDTFVESPVVAAWVNSSLERMRKAAEEQDMPILVHKLTPNISDSFWVNIIGRGYPAPRPNFRWCTDRLKIKPSNNFIIDVVAKHGEAILVLGTRSAESSRRAANMKKYQQMRVRDWLSPTKTLSNCLTYTPIEDWSNDDVWIYLMQYPNPWGQMNKDLLTMYQGASADGDCPLVVDTNTPSCGSSRFGCWVCTMVKEDKSMQAMIQNDEEKIWMTPLLNFRNKIGNFDDRDKREYRRMSGKVLIFNNRAVHGPYKKWYREELLRDILTIEKEVQQIGPQGFENLRIISDEELRWIRKIWVVEKHEFDDSLPQIYEEITGKPYKFTDSLSSSVFGKKEWVLLYEVCNGDEDLFGLQANLLDISQQYSIFTIKKGILQEFEDTIKRFYYENEEEAVKVNIEIVERKRYIEEKTQI
ncbi:MAG: sulfurtransferase DndC [Peptococcaceae bacterium BRH_c4a]|nr:MAG: sulfurtransferase DndC [Peptococcaceae bacterium BRH_c4a]